MSESPGPPEVATDPAIAFDAGHFRMVMGHFPTGVTIVTGHGPDGPTGFTIGSFTSVSLDPPLVGFLPQTDSVTWEMIAPSGRFCVNVLSAEQDDLCWRFAKTGTETTRFDGVTWHESPSGSPILDRAVAWIDCVVEEVYTMGDHYFVLGRVEFLDADPDHDGLPPRPLVFFRGNIGGFSSDSPIRILIEMTSDERLPTIAASLDALCIVIFVTIGRRNHDESAAMSGILRTAAPFAIALFIAWAVVRAWRQPTTVRTGLMIWPIVILVGMLLRHFVFDDGTAASFVVVATIFLGLFLVGWRAVWTLVASRRQRPARAA